MLDAFGLPSATAYGIFGIVWIFALGFMHPGLRPHRPHEPGLLPPPRRARDRQCLPRAGRQGAPAAGQGQRPPLGLRPLHAPVCGHGLLPFWYWTLGARLGKGVVLGNTDVWEDPHLVTMGDDVAVTDMAALETVTEPGNGYAECGAGHGGRRARGGRARRACPGRRAGQRGGAHAAVGGGAAGARAPDAVMMGVPARKILDRSSIPGGSTRRRPPRPRRRVPPPRAGPRVHDWAVMQLLQGLLTPLALVCPHAPPRPLLPLPRRGSSSSGPWPTPRPRRGLARPPRQGRHACRLPHLLGAPPRPRSSLEKWAPRGRQREGVVVPVRGPALPPPQPAARLPVVRLHGRARHAARHGPRPALPHPAGCVCDAFACLLDLGFCLFV